MSSVSEVSDVFAFVAQHAEFTNGILFAEDEVPEVRPDQRAAMSAVLDHLKDSYVGLLEQCRSDLVARAEGDAALKATMETNWNRPKSIWDRAQVEMGIVPSFGVRVIFWIGVEPTKPKSLSLVAEIWSQVQHRDALRKVGAEASLPLTNGTLRLAPRELNVGVSFAELSQSLAEQLWPLINAVRGHFMATQTKT